MKKIISYLMVVLIALIMALNYHLFIFPNSFAPAGLNGIFTMIQHVLGFKLSYTSIILNVPLAILVYFVVSKPYALRSLTYALAFSGFLMMFDQIDLAPFVYDTTVSTLLGPAVAGLITGFCGYYMLRVGACYGGTEFIAKLIHKRRPTFNLFTVIFVLNITVAFASYFVYGYKIEPVLLCIIYSYASSSVRDNMNQRDQRAVRCEIVTDKAELLRQEIIEKLHHTATVITGKGLYSGEEKSVLICIVNPSQEAELMKLVAEHPGSFVSVGNVRTVLGNFKRLDRHSQPEKHIYDSGKTAVKE